MAGRCDCDKTCSCAMVGTKTVAVGGSGAAAQPFKPSVRIMPGNGNTLAENDAGLAAYTLLRDTASGDPLSIAEDGYVQLPGAFIRDAGGSVIAPAADRSVKLPSGGTPAYGTGLEVVSGALVPKVNDGDGAGWPVNDLQGSPLAGTVDDLPTILSPLFRGSAFGERGVPDHTSIRGGAGDVLVDATLVNVTSSYTTPPSSIYSVTNPSRSRRMNVMRAMLGVVRLSCPVGGLAAVALQAKVNAGAWTTVGTRHWPVPTSGTQAIQFEGEVNKTAGSVIAPGATHSVQLRLTIVREGAGTDPPVFLNASAACELLGVTI